MRLDFVFQQMFGVFLQLWRLSLNHEEPITKADRQQLLDKRMFSAADPMVWNCLRFGYSRKAKCLHVASNEEVCECNAGESQIPVVSTQVSAPS